MNKPCHCSQGRSSMRTRASGNGTKTMDQDRIKEIPHMDPTMDLSRILLQLVTTNQQLTLTHGQTLAYFKNLYTEFAKRMFTNDVKNRWGKKHNFYEKSLEYRISRLERILSSKRSIKRNNQWRRNVRFQIKNSNNFYKFKKLERTFNDTIVESEQKSKTKSGKRLLVGTTNQRHINDRSTRDYQTIKVKDEIIQGNLIQEYEELRIELEHSNRDREKLVEEKIIAEARIFTLEQSLIEKESMKNDETQKISNLRIQLSAEVADKEKQVDALREALCEIERLKRIMKTEDEDVDVLDDSNEEVVSKNRSNNLEEFKKDLMLKREARQRAIAAVSSEMDRLRRELEEERQSHVETNKALETLKLKNVEFDVEHKDEIQNTIIKEDERSTKFLKARRLKNILKVSDELRHNIRVQIEKLDDLRYQLENEPEQYRNEIQCLSDMTNRVRTVVNDREQRANDLKDSLAQVLVRLEDPSLYNAEDDVGEECDCQIENINTLKTLYKERLRILTKLKDSSMKELREVKDQLQYNTEGSMNLKSELQIAVEKIDAQDTEISNLESQLGLTKADCRDLQNQMSLINGLFTQMLLGASSADMDLDRLTQLLQENHDLISDMAREEGTEAAALPKLLLDIIEQVDGRKESVQQEENVQKDCEMERKEDDLQEDNIAHNLPKVWRVLLELLSCHAVTAPSVPIDIPSDPNSCYKSVDTPAGPRLVISVSKTYIRLKDLILEKKSLEKEMNRMKQLNVHLESRLGEQEKKLSMVSDELNKTWTIVGRMQAQHQQLHTHEKILRYELQQKRKMLQELKQELEYCREKWEAAREKNTTTEIEWRKLRREFAARKALTGRDSFNNSGESGFSDERGDDTDEEDEAVEERVRFGTRRRPRKENPRISSPDTESEQPTDNDMSEPKTTSSIIMEQRTPSPESEGECEDIEGMDTDLTSGVYGVIDREIIPNVLEESLVPLDQALTNVIQDLVNITNNGLSDENSVPIFQEHLEPTNITCENLIQEEPGPTVESESSNSISIFAIGPFPESISKKSVQFNDPTIVESFDQISQVSPEKLYTLDTIDNTIHDDSSKKLDSKMVKGESFSKNEHKPSSSTGEKVSRTPEEVLAARANRLKRLEEQANWLMKKMNATKEKGSALNNRLEELHEVYGEPPIPPPMPDILPSQRLQTSQIPQSEDRLHDDETATRSDDK